MALVPKLIGWFLKPISGAFELNRGKKIWLLKYVFIERIALFI